MKLPQHIIDEMLAAGATLGPAAVLPPEPAQACQEAPGTTQAKGKHWDDGHSFDDLCEASGLGRPRREFRFHEERKWRFDFYFGSWVALEIQGGLFSGGRHVRGKSLLKEYEKLNEAACRGYAVLFCTPQQAVSGEIIPVIRRALEAKGETP